MSRPRIRTFKPEFFKDKRVLSLPVQARYMLLGLFSLSDDRGRQVLHEPGIIGHVFPRKGEATIKQVTFWLESIVKSGIGAGYHAEKHGEHELYLWFPKFWDHQIINRPSESEHPPHPQDPYGNLGVVEAMKAHRHARKTHGSFTDHSVINHGSITTPRGRARVPLPSSSRSKEGSNSQQPVLTRELVDEACGLLAAHGWDVNEVGVENAIGAFPGRDVERACRTAVVWGSKADWRMDAAGTLWKALEKQGDPSVADVARERKARRGAALENLLRSTTTGEVA